MFQSIFNFFFPNNKTPKYKYEYLGENVVTRQQYGYISITRKIPCSIYRKYLVKTDETVELYCETGISDEPRIKLNPKIWDDTKRFVFLR